MNRNMIHIKQQSNVFCDSFVANNTGILFASFWGRSTSLQQFLARMELSVYEDGINQLTFEVSEGNDQTFPLQSSKNMQKLSGRVPDTIFDADLSHVFIYDKSTVNIDYSNHKATILYFDNIKIDNTAIWQLIKDISPIPLLDIWMEQMIDTCFKDEYIHHIDGFGGVGALVVDLDTDEFEGSVTQMIKHQVLLVA